MLRWKKVRSIDLESQLKALYGPQAAFRGLQREAITTILQGRSPVVIVMPTGGGKSLAFMLPTSCATSGLTIVVVPLLSLR